MRATATACTRPPRLAARSVAPADRQVAWGRRPIGRLRLRRRRALREIRPPPRSAEGGRPPPSGIGPTVRLLLVAQAPPAADDRYFYFPDVPTQDALFRSVARIVLPHTEPTRSNKASLLEQLRDRGVFLVDLKPDPVDGSVLSQYVPKLLARIAELAPERIILIKADVYDAVYPALARAGLPVSSVRVPFPSFGQQSAFNAAFSRALAGE